MLSTALNERGAAPAVPAKSNAIVSPSMRAQTRMESRTAGSSSSSTRASSKEYAPSGHAATAARTRRSLYA